MRADVMWLGREGLRWNSVIHYFNSCLFRNAPPNVLVIHCGGNDLGEKRSLQLASDMKRDMQDLHRRFPKMVIVLSAIIQRLCWGSLHPRKIDRARKRVNKYMTFFLDEINGNMVHHHQIVYNNYDLFHQDQVHLSRLGNDIFLNDISEHLRAWAQALRFS